MHDCPSRHAHHPILTPMFHHVLRVCDGCHRIGCVVPRCRRHLFDPADERLHWTDAPASGEAHRTWRCISCGEVRSSWSRIALDEHGPQQGPAR